MKRTRNLLIAFLLICITFALYNHNSYAKVDSTNVEKAIDTFFEDRYKAIEKKDSIYGTRLKNEDKAELSVNVDNNKLEEYLLDYMELQKVIFEESNIKEDIINEKIDKEIKQEDGKIIAYVTKTKESLFTIDGVKSNEPSYEVARYKFIFDQNSGKLIDFIPESSEEKALMTSDMKRLIREEAAYRPKSKNDELFTKDDDQISISPKAYSRYNYNRVNMVNYAKKYALSRNKNYGDLSNMGGDCANFVSQIIKAGGAPFDTTGSYRWYYYSLKNSVSSWRGANELYKYLLGNDYIGPQGKLASSSDDIQYNMRLGDPVFIDFNHNGIVNHAVSITSYQIGAQNQTKVSAHTTDRINYPLLSYPGYKNYVMLTKFGK